MFTALNSSTNCKEWNRLEGTAEVPTLGVGETNQNLLRDFGGRWNK